MLNKCRGRPTPMVVAASRISLLLVVLPSTAHAQAPTAPVPSDTIVVTARRSLVDDARIADIRPEPASTSIPAHDSFELLREVAPDVGLFNVNASQASLAMRGGTSLDESPAADPAVALYVDDFYLGRGPAARVRALNVARVAVHKGPQGTRFGRNALGGAVNFISEDLPEKFEARIQGIAGTPRRMSVEASASGPLAGGALGSVTLYGNSLAGNVRNRITGSRRGDEDEIGAQIRLQHNIGARHYLWASASTQYEWAKLEPRFLWFNLKPASFPAATILDRRSVFQLEDAETKVVVHRLIVKGGIDSERRSGWQLIAGWQDADILVRNNDFAPGGGAATILATETVDEEESVSLEARGWTRLGPVEGLAGLYWRHADAFRSEDFIVDPAPGSQASFIFGDQRKRAFVAQDVNSLELAGFASAALKVAPNLTLEAGGRYTWERKKGHTEVTGDPNTYLLRGQPFRAAWRESWASFTPRAELRWTPAGIVLQLAWANGFKAGGFTNSVNNPASAVVPFDPEKAKMLEASLRVGEATTRGAFTFTGFRVDYRDLQTLLVRNDPNAGIVQQVVNAGSARSQGVDLTYRLARGGWGVTFAATYLDAHYRDFVTVDTAGRPLDFSGDPVPLSPKYSLRLSVEFTKGIGPLPLVPGMRFLYRSKVSFFPDASQSSLVRDQSDFHDVGAWVRWPFSGGSLTVSGTNLLDERPFTFANNASSSFVFSGAELAQGARLFYGSRATGREINLTLDLSF